uniref:Uncharacterized protein n=1 Tax=Utricularia reniformis TaxID=192314 RepID=A0A1Y0B0A8_9LAMI|nr:hypothetical protein AEK19_MT0577 [Utricularia reniformis]ART30833.1 hypothetical protein AEK19_MT0577 [Utricularia reniformis]
MNYKGKGPAQVKLADRQNQLHDQKTSRQQMSWWNMMSLQIESAN